MEIILGEVFVLTWPPLRQFPFCKSCRQMFKAIFSAAAAAAEPVTDNDHLIFFILLWFLDATFKEMVLQSLTTVS